MKKVILVVTFMSAVLSVSAQDFIDNALLFSRTRPNGSARIQAVGGAQVALGGDYSSALSNPAGLGFYNRSEVTFSAGLNFSDASSNYFGQGRTDSKSTFNIPGFSIVFHRGSDRSQGFMGGAFAITLNRINDFNQNFQYSGRNDNNSIVDYFINDAGDINPEELLSNGSYYYSLTSLAYRNYLIEDIEDNGFFYDSPLTFNSSRQTEISERRGAQYQWSLAYGANFSDKFFVGGSLGISTIRFKLSQRYTEDDLVYPDVDYRPLNDFTAEEEYDIRGSGVNLTLGAMYRPVDFIQIGASFVTPTYFSITDSYTARVESNWNNFDYYPDDTEDEPLNFVSDEFEEPLLYEYNLTTPLRFSTGVTLISKFGFITTDIEFVNYRKAKYSSDIAGEFQGENNSIKAELNSVINYRIGAEFRKDIYRIRLGFSQMAEPYSFDSDADRKIRSITGGVGVRLDKFFIDLGVVSSKTNGTRTPYFLEANSPMAKNKFSNLDFVLTAGLSF